MMFNSIIPKIQGFFNNIRNKVTAYRECDPVIIKKSVNINLASFRQSAPDKPYIDLTVKGEPQATIADMLVFTFGAFAVVSTVWLISKMLFSLMFKKRW